MKRIITIMMAAIILISLAGCNNQPPAASTTSSASVENTTVSDIPSTSTTESSQANTPEPTTEAATEPSPVNTPEPLPDNTPEPTPEPEESGGPDEPATASAPSGELSDDWSSFEAELNGKVYYLPAHFSEFAADGWTMDDESETLSPNTHSTILFRKGDQIVYATMLNFTANVLTFNECHIEKLALDIFDAKRGAKLYLPGGITVGESNSDDVLAAYGEPSDIYEGTSVISYTYSEGTYSNARIQFDIETMEVNRVEIGNATPREPVAPPEVSGEIPESVANYVTPLALGESWDTFTVKYAGDLYALPAPVSVFADNGWKIISTDVVVPARTHLVGFEMSKNNQTLRAQIYNYSDSAQPAENCFVFFIRCSVNGPDLTLELPGGITMDSTYEDLVRAFGEPDESDQPGEMFIYHTYGSFNEQISISFFVETGSIGTVDVTYRPRDLD